MAHSNRTGPWPVHGLLFCILASLAAMPMHCAAADKLHGVPGLQDVLTDLETWLDENTSLPRQEDVPALRWVEAGPVAVPSATRFETHGKKSRGYYDPDSRTIWLIQPWNPQNPMDVSVLLHELIHHRQTSAKHWYCPGAQELPAYRLQQAWLAEFDLEVSVNWIEVVLEAGCTPRDIHPD